MAGRAVLRPALIAGMPPVDPRQHHAWIDLVTIFQCNIHQRVQQGVGKQMRLQTEFNQLRVFGVVIMFLGLHSWIGEMIDFYGQPQLLAGGLHHVC